MIVPRTRLILLTAAIMPVSGLLIAWWIESCVYVMVAVPMLVVICAIDSRSRMSELKALTVVMPDVVRTTVDKVSEIRIVIGKPEVLATRLRLGLALAYPMTSEQKDLHVILEEGRHEMVVNWSCRPLRRGRYMIHRCHIEVVSKMRLWALRKRFSVRTEVRTYPNLIHGQQQLSGIFQRRQWGMRTQRRVGKGREFEQLREYLPGDSFEDIDWKATARRRHPISRVYQVEQAQEIYVVLDASRLSTRSAAYIMDRRSLKRSEPVKQASTIFERFITAALIMAIVSEKLSDRYGLLIFDDKPEYFIKAGRGSMHYNACRDALYNRMPKNVSPDFDELFTFIGTHLRKRALLVFLTSLDDPVLAESFAKAMRTASRQHLLMVNMFRPPGAHPLFSSPDIKKNQGIYQHLVGHMLWASISETHRKLKKAGASLYLLDENQLCHQLVNQYMDIKQRQII